MPWRRLKRMGHKHSRTDRRWLWMLVIVAVLLIVVLSSFSVGGTPA